MGNKTASEILAESGFNEVGVMKWPGTDPQRWPWPKANQSECKRTRCAQFSNSQSAFLQQC